MSASFERMAAEIRGGGQAADVRFVLAELRGLVAGAVAEWIAKLTTDRCVRGRVLPDWRLMRPVGIPREVWFAGPRP